MKKLYLSVSLLISMLLTGCASAPIGNTVALSNTLSYVLTPPPVAYVSKTESHLVEIAYGEESHKFIAQVEYGKNEIAMAAISIEGLPLFDFVWQTETPVKINQYVPLPNIKIHNIIADMQLCHWPIAQIALSIQGKDVIVKQQDELDDSSLIWQRTISQRNELVIKINKSSKGIQLEHLLHNYRIKLTDLNQEGI